MKSIGLAAAVIFAVWFLAASGASHIFNTHYSSPGPVPTHIQVLFFGLSGVACVLNPGTIAGVGSPASILGAVVFSVGWAVLVRRTVAGLRMSGSTQ